MTDRRTPTDDEVEAWVARALEDEMIPTDPEQVRRAEREFAAQRLAADQPRPEETRPNETRPDQVRPDQVRPDETRPDETRPDETRPDETRPDETRPDETRPRAALPSRPRASEPRPTPVTRLPYWQLGASAALGALAASVAFAMWAPRADSVTIGPGGDPVIPDPLPDSPADDRWRIEVPCENCCGGSACRKQAEACASGRRCVSCVPAPQGRYRMRLGDLAWVEKGAARPGTRLCLSVGAHVPECFEAAGAEPRVPWQSSASSFSPSALLSGVSLSLVPPVASADASESGKASGAPESLASWQRELAVTAGVLCKGLGIELQGPEGEVVARLSMFLDDAQFIELARSNEIAPLRKRLSGIESAGTTPRIYETKSGKGGRFALTFGPLSAPQAEHVRWQLLELGAEPRAVWGDDYVGEPMPALPR